MRGKLFSERFTRRLIVCGDASNRALNSLVSLSVGRSSQLSVVICLFLFFENFFAFIPKNSDSFFFQKRQNILCEFIIYCKLATGEYVHLLGRTSQDKNLPKRFPLSSLEQFPQQSFPILRRDRNSLLLCCCCWPWRPRPDNVQKIH